MPNKLDLGALRLYLSYPIIEVLLGEVSAMTASSNNNCIYSLFILLVSTMVKSVSAVEKVMWRELEVLIQKD